MRVLILAVTLIAAFTASNACAQSQPSPLVSQFMSHKDIMALIDKAKADRKPNAPLTAEQIVRLAPYHAQVEYRPGNAPAAVHEKDAEFMVVLEGTGSIITEGKLVNEKRVNAYNLSGTSISGGNPHAVVAGDVIFIPPNTPHQVIAGGGAPIVLMTMHVPYPPTGWQLAH